MALQEKDGTFTRLALLFLVALGLLGAICLLLYLAVRLVLAGLLALLLLLLAPAMLLAPAFGDSGREAFVSLGQAARRRAGGQADLRAPARRRRRGRRRAGGAAGRLVRHLAASDRLLVGHPDQAPRADRVSLARPARPRATRRPDPAARLPERAGRQGRHGRRRSCCCGAPDAGRQARHGGPPGPRRGAPPCGGAVGHRAARPLRRGTAPAGARGGRADTRGPPRPVAHQRCDRPQARPVRGPPRRGHCARPGRPGRPPRTNDPSSRRASGSTVSSTPTSSARHRRSRARPSAPAPGRDGRSARPSLPPGASGGAGTSTRASPRPIRAACGRPASTRATTPRPTPGERERLERLSAEAIERDRALLGAIPREERRAPLPGDVERAAVRFDRDELLQRRREERAAWRHERQVRRRRAHLYRR